MPLSKLGHSFWLKYQYLFLAIIIIIACFFRFYNLEQRFSFGWDQARDAQVLWQIIKEGKFTLIGPQVVSDNSFFLGPLWYYFLAPFYLIFRSNPLAEAVAAAFVGPMTTIAIYLFIRKLIGINTALLASLIWASMSDITAWNPILIPLSEISILYFLFKFIDGDKKSIIYALLLFALGLQLHFQMIFLTIPTILSFYIYFKHNQALPFKEISLGVIFFGLTFLPLFIFDLRHSFLNGRGFLKIFGIGTINPHNNLNLISQFNTILPKFISTNFFLLPTLPLPKIVLGAVVLVCSLIGILASGISYPKKITFLSLLILPVVLFSFYKGTLSEYYFSLCSIPLLFGFCLFLKKIFNLNYVGKVAIVFLIIALLGSNTALLLNSQNVESLYYKEQAVKYLKNQKMDKLINVSFDTPANEDTSFKYLFQYFDLKVENIPQAHLWTIVIPAYSDNITPIAYFGNIGLLRR